MTKWQWIDQKIHRFITADFMLIIYHYICHSKEGQDDLKILKIYSHTLNVTVKTFIMLRTFKS